MAMVGPRSALGGQSRWCETALAVRARGPGPVDAVFIRGPWIEEAGPQVEILAEDSGHPVAAREGALLVTAFHPELSGERRFHEWLVARARSSRGSKEREGRRERVGTQ